MQGQWTKNLQRDDQSKVLHSKLNWKCPQTSKCFVQSPHTKPHPNWPTTTGPICKKIKECKEKLGEGIRSQFSSTKTSSLKLFYTNPTNHCYFSRGAFKPFLRRCKGDCLRLYFGILATSVLHTHKIISHRSAEPFGPELTVEGLTAEDSELIIIRQYFGYFNGLLFGCLWE